MCCLDPGPKAIAEDNKGSSPIYLKRRKWQFQLPCILLNGIDVTPRKWKAQRFPCWESQQPHGSLVWPQPQIAMSSSCFSSWIIKDRERLWWQMEDIEDLLGNYQCFPSLNFPLVSHYFIWGEWRALESPHRLHQFIPESSLSCFFSLICRTM